MIERPTASRGTQLTLDGGQSGIRTLLTRGGETVPGPEFSGIRSHVPLLEQLAGFIRDALAGDRVDVVAAGVSGLGPLDSAAELRGLLAGAAERVFVAHDSTTSFIGALGVVEGAVVAAGTGAVTLVVGPSRVRRVDGWGHLLGDLGSGFWIGREALSAVLAAYDGRGPATSLTDEAVAEFGDLSRLYLQVQTDPERVKRVASWARGVSRHAATDDVARDIAERAGVLLADSVVAALGAVDATPRVSQVGNVFLGHVIDRSFRVRLQERLPAVEVVPAAGTGLDGAAQLPLVGAESPLWALVDRA